MATNEEEPVNDTPTRPEIIRQFVAQATDTGPTTGISLRVWLILVGLGIVVALAIFPLNVLGTVLLVALALSLASRVRGTR